MKKRGQAGVVTVVLLILIVIIALIVVANVVYGIVKKNTSDSDSTDALTLNMEIKQTKLLITGGAQVNVYRGVGEGTVSGLKFIFENNNGERKIITRNENLSEMTQKNFVFNASEIGYSNSEINKIFVVPIMGSSVGSEVGEKPEIVKKDAGGNRLVYLYDNLAVSPGDLVSWWKFDGNYLDSVGHNDLTPFGDVKIINNELVLDGNGDYLKVFSPSLNITQGSITISAWVNTQSLTNVGRVAGRCVLGASGYGIGVEVGYVNTGHCGGSNFNSISTLSANQWYHIVGITDGSNSKVYINGTLDQRGSVVVTANPAYIHEFSIGSSSDGSGGYIYFFNGSIDDVMLFNRSLSAEEISALYNDQKK